jgi:hypothetical protein
VLPPVEETVFSNFLKGCDDGILHVGLVGFNCAHHLMFKKEHILGNGFVPVHRGMDDNLCYISDKFLSD